MRYEILFLLSFLTYADISFFYYDDSFVLSWLITAESYYDADMSFIVQASALSPTAQ